MSTPVDGGMGADGTNPSAGVGAVSVGGADAVGGSGAGGSGSSSGGQGTPECTAEQKLCGGMCVEANDPTYGCGAATCDASACPSQVTGATVACEGSTCVIATCPADYKNCGDKCVAISDPTYGCSETTCDAKSCPAPGSGTLVCRDSACVIGVCGAGTKKCGSNCVTTDANHGCEDASRCTACANNEACSGTPTTCQCVPTPKASACSGKNCGSAPNGCGGMYACGTCSSPSAPICVSGTCKQCGSVADCPSGTFNCTNNACVCRTPKSENVIKDGGFDDASALNSWTSTDTVWTNSDADSCPESGSITISGSVKRCFQIPQVPPGGKDYTFGIRYKAGGGGTGGCVGGSYQDSNCTQGGGFLINLAAGESSSWTEASFTASVPEGTSSIDVQCQNSSFLTIDQAFLRPSGFTGWGF